MQKAARLISNVGRKENLKKMCRSFLKNHECIKNFAQTIALIAAGLFFFVKLVMGFLIVNMDTSVSSQRFIDAQTGKGYLLINVYLNRGENSSLELHRIRVRVIEFGEKSDPIIRDFKGVKRVVDGEFQTWEYATKNQYIRLPPGESTHFSELFDVKIEKAYFIEVSVQGRRLNSTSHSQWKATTVSPPTGWSEKNVFTPNHALELDWAKPCRF